jgi:tetratricopeptide (TPR) repeat protein
MRHLLLIFAFLLAAVGLSAQASTVFTEANAAYHRGMDFFNQNLYGLAQKEFRTVMEMLRPVNEPEWKAVKTDAELHHAKCAVRLGQPEAEKMVLDFLRENSPSPVANQAALEIGDYYFNNKEYDKALTYYDMAPAASGPSRDEIQFKKGYSYFISKKFSQAKAAFGSIRENTRSARYYDANYYYGCCAFFEGKYDEAQKSFARCEGSDKYKQYIPYYLTQIYAAKKQYDQVISYGAPKAQNADIRNRAELNQLIGQAYYERGDYKKAMPYLEYAVNNGVSLRPADYYQLGYTQYQNGFYKPAIENFEQLTKQDSLLGQNGLYHLGDSYIRTGNKFAARNAFGQAANMNLDKSVKEDALFNYAKLSYELKYDRDAIEALQKIPAGSKYYEDAQALMSEVFLNTRDYDRAIATLESVRNRTPRLNETYQKVCYYRGIQLYQNGQKEEARRYFNKSLEQPSDHRLAALCSYWMGAIANEGGDYATSKQHITAFLNQAKNYGDLPEESNAAMGNYIQGYNFLKGKEYRTALGHFKFTVDALKRNEDRIRTDQIKNALLSDAILRAGDCHFKLNQYNDAIAYYNDAINRKDEGFEYALYQKAMIKGLQGQQTDKIVSLENLVDKYPGSRFTDEALYQLGSTYQDLGKFDQATQPLRRLVQDFRGKSNLVNQALLRLGLISYNQGNTNAATNYYKQVFANNPEAAEAKDALSALEEIYVKDLNRPDEYLAFLETVPGYNVNTASKDSVIYQSANIQFQNGNSLRTDQTTTFTANASDMDGIQRIEVFVNNNLVKTCDGLTGTTSNTCVATLNGWNYTAGQSLSVSARVTDAYGYQTWSSTYALSVVNPGYNSGNGTISDSLSSTVLPKDGTLTYMVNAYPYGSIGLDRVEIYLDGALRKTCPLYGSANTATCTETFSGANYADGSSHTVQAKSVDIYGAAQWTSGRSFQVGYVNSGNNAAGSITASVSPTQTLELGKTGTFTAMAYDATGIDTVKLYVNGELKKTCSGYNASALSCSMDVVASSWSAYQDLFLNAVVIDRDGQQAWSSGSSLRIVPASATNGGSNGNTSGPQGTISIAADKSTYGNTDTVTFTATASQATTIDILVNAVSVKTCQNATTCSYVGGPYGTLKNVSYAARMTDGLYGLWTGYKTVSHK